MAESSDSSEVQAFMAAFQKLRHLVDDAPELIVREAQQNMSLLKVCDEVSWAAHWLRQQERVRRELHLSSANPAFVSAWRAYESNWAKPIVTVLSLCSTDDFDLRLPAKVEHDPSMQPALREESWKEIDAAARSAAAAIESAIREAEIAADTFPGIEELERHWVNDVRDGIDTWRFLADQLGFDLPGVFRRRDLVPFVMIPRHVSKQHGAAEPLSLLTLLQQAQEAFILWRSVRRLRAYESDIGTALKKPLCVIRNRLRDLKELIDSARGLPQNVRRERLHKIRQLGNDVLHFKKVYFSKERTNDIAKLEGEVISHFGTLQTLI